MLNLNSPKKDSASKKTIYEKVMWLAITCVSFCVIVAFLVFTIKLCGAFFAKFSFVFIPLIVAAIISIIIKPFVDWLSMRQTTKSLSSILYKTQNAVQKIILFWKKQNNGKFSEAAKNEAANAKVRISRMLSFVFLTIIFVATISLVVVCIDRCANKSGENKLSLKEQIINLENIKISDKIIDSLKIKDSTADNANFKADGTFWNKNLEKIRARIDESKKEFDISKILEDTDGIKKGAEVAMGITSTSLALGLAIVVTPIYLFFMVISESKPQERLYSFINKYSPSAAQKYIPDFCLLIDNFLTILVNFFRGQFVIAIIDSILLSIGFGLAGIQAGWILGFFIGLTNIVPFLAYIVGLIVLPIAYFQESGGIKLVLIAVGIFALVKLLEDFVWTPLVMKDIASGTNPKQHTSEKTGAKIEMEFVKQQETLSAADNRLSPMTIIFSIFFWGTALGGIMGMLLAIPLTAFFKSSWYIIKRHLILVSEQDTEASNTKSKQP